LDRDVCAEQERPCDNQKKRARRRSAR
jgi:hypothetical protein